MQSRCRQAGSIGAGGGGDKTFFKDECMQKPGVIYMYMYMHVGFPHGKFSSLQISTDYIQCT